MNVKRPIVIDLDDKTTDMLDLDNTTPIVLELKKKRGKEKKKRRYSRGLEEIQEVERHFTRSMHRLASAAEKGISTYRERSGESAEKKKDGAIKDLIPNSGAALSETIEELSPLPKDLARMMDTKQNRRRLRRQLRGISRTLKRWRW
jgi:hypothetical protein